MKGSDRIILVGLPLLAIVVGFWFLAIAPKRNEASELQDRIDGLNSSIQASEAQIAASEAAREAFPENYGELVTLGRAVPEDGDQSTLLYDLSGLANDNKVEFRDFELLSGGTGVETSAAATAATPPTTSTSESAPPAEQGNAAQPAPAAASTAPAIATEATAAGLPIGAVVGPAGLPAMPYEFKFLGSFFHMADFFADVDGTVVTTRNGPDVSGRLMTIDGFALTADQFTGFPDVTANFAVTTYIVPPEQGLSAGASPAGPAPTTSATPTPVTAPAPAGNPATAAVTP